MFFCGQGQSARQPSYQMRTLGIYRNLGNPAFCSSNGRKTNVNRRETKTKVHMQKTPRNCACTSRYLRKTHLRLGASAHQCNLRSSLQDFVGAFPLLPVRPALQIAIGLEEVVARRGLQAAAANSQVLVPPRAQLVSPGTARGAEVRSKVLESRDVLPWWVRGNS